MKTIKQPEKNKCLYCGKKISGGWLGRRQYCNDACKQAAYRERKSVTVLNGNKGGA